MSVKRLLPRTFTCCPRTPVVLVTCSRRCTVPWEVNVCIVSSVQNVHSPPNTRLPPVDVAGSHPDAVSYPGAVLNAGGSSCLSSLLYAFMVHFQDRSSTSLWKIVWEKSVRLVRVKGHCADVIPYRCCGCVCVVHVLPAVSGSFQTDEKRVRTEEGDAVVQQQAAQEVNS